MQMTESAAAKHPLEPIKTLNVSVSARLSIEIIVSNEITSSVKPTTVFISADKDRQRPIYM